QMNVSERAVRDAKTVWDRSTEEETAQVRAGEETVSRAAKIIRAKEKDIRKAAKDDPARFGDLAERLDKGGKVDPVHKELRKREKKPTTKGDVIKDSLGNDVPDHLKDIFGDPWLNQVASAIEEIARDALTSITNKVVKKGQAYGWLACGEAVKNLNRSKEDLTA